MLRQAALSVMPCVIRLSIPCVLVVHALSLHLKCVIYYLTQKIEIERSKLLWSLPPLLKHINLKINLHIIVHLHNIICMMYNQICIQWSKCSRANVNCVAQSGSLFQFTFETTTIVHWKFFWVVATVATDFGDLKFKISMYCGLLFNHASKLNCINFHDIRFWISKNDLID